MSPAWNPWGNSVITIARPPDLGTISGLNKEIARVRKKLAQTAGLSGSNRALKLRHSSLIVRRAGLLAEAFEAATNSDREVLNSFPSSPREVRRAEREDRLLQQDIERRLSSEQYGKWSDAHGWTKRVESGYKRAVADSEEANKKAQEAAEAYEKEPNDANREELKRAAEQARYAAELKADWAEALLEALFAEEQALHYGLVTCTKQMMDACIQKLHEECPAECLDPDHECVCEFQTVPSGFPWQPSIGVPAQRGQRARDEAAFHRERAEQSADGGKGGGDDPGDEPSAPNEFGSVLKNLGSTLVDWAKWGAGIVSSAAERPYASSGAAPKGPITGAGKPKRKKEPGKKGRTGVGPGSKAPPGGPPQAPTVGGNVPKKQDRPNVKGCATCARALRTVSAQGKATTSQQEASQIRCLRRGAVAAFGKAFVDSETVRDGKRMKGRALLIHLVHLCGQAKMHGGQRGGSSADVDGDIEGPDTESGVRPDGIHANVVARFSVAQLIPIIIGGPNKNRQGAVPESCRSCDPLQVLGSSSSEV